MYYYKLNLMLLNPDPMRRFDLREYQSLIEMEIHAFNNAKQRNPKKISNWEITADILCLEIESTIPLKIPIKSIRTFSMGLLKYDKFKQVVYKNALFKNVSKLKIIEWNINQRSGSESKEIPPFIGEEIKKQNADIVVLTEFYKAENWVKFISDTFSSYKYFYTMNPDKQNDVLIAIKNTHKITHVEYLYSEYGNDNPNLLRVDIIADGKPLTVIGIRIRVSNYGKKPKREDFNTDKDFSEAYSKWEKSFIGEKKWRKKQNNIIINHVRRLENPAVIVGDFNCFKSEYIDDIWCMQKVKKTYEDEHYEWNHIDGSSIYSENSGFAEDHIITKDLLVREQIYSRDFAIASGRKGAYPKGKNFTETRVPNPDHAILIATIIRR